MGNIKKENKTIKRDVPILVKEIREYILSVKENNLFTLEQRKKLFGFYSVYYSETQTNYECDICLARIVSRLKTI